MLPQTNRLPLRTTRRQVESQATAFPSSLFTFLVARLPDRTDLPSRFAIIVSKKLSPHATTRNLLRRRTLAALQENLAQLHLGFDTLILPKKNLLTADYPQIQADIIRLLTTSKQLVAS